MTLLELQVDKYQCFMVVADCLLDAHVAPNNPQDLPKPTGEVAHLLSELAQGGDEVNAEDYWVRGEWDIEGLRDDATGLVIVVLVGRRLVAVAFTLMGAFSIDLQLDQSLEALGFRVPDSLEVDFYTRELVGPGQPVQLQLRTIEHPHVWKAGTLKQGFPTTLVLSDSESENALRTEEGAQAPALDSSTACEEDTQAAMLTLSVHANAIGG
eukprot:s4651_g1.t3